MAEKMFEHKAKFQQQSTDSVDSSTAFPPNFSLFDDVFLLAQPRVDTMHDLVSMASRKHNPGQILLFPGVRREPSLPNVTEGAASEAYAAVAFDVNVPSEIFPAMRRVVLSGSYRKDFEGLKASYEELKDLGCVVLSPTSVEAVSEVNGFVYMKGEESQSPDSIESRHLDAIQRASFIWLHAPSGYVGPTASLEIGFARAAGVPVYAREPLADPSLHTFVETVASPSNALERIASGTPVPRPALTAFQNYYRTVAIQRGYNTESPRDCLLLMVEEVGELARDVRKWHGLVRHAREPVTRRTLELADVFLYVVHMANILDVDLAKIVQEKELINLQKFLRR